MVLVKNKSNRSEKKREREREKEERGKKNNNKKNIDQYHDRLVKGAKNKNLLHRPNILKSNLAPSQRE